MSLTARLPAATRELLDRTGLAGMRDKVLAGERLSFEDGVRLYRGADLASVGALANLVRERQHGDRTYFNRNVHVNATNVCEADCIFCSFARLRSDGPGAYAMPIDQAVGRIRALRDAFLTEVHVVNGLNPDLPFAYYTDLLRAIRAERPDLHIKAFTAVEVHYFAVKFGMTYREVLEALVDAGLGSMPGGGAEIFAERARRKLCPDKVDAAGWLEVHRTAHALGLRTNCTMLFGCIERVEERVDHVLRLRDLQDETGGFQAFIPLKFHAENNRLGRLPEPSALECLRVIAVCRLLLDNVPHVKAYWPMLGTRVAQISQWCGVSDLDGTVREERVYHMAGATTPQMLSRSALIGLIRAAGRVPVERDTLYHVAAEA